MTTPSEPRWRRYLRFWKRNVAADVDDELRFHFDERVAQYLATGMTRDHAIAAARAQFGDVVAVRDELVGIDRRIVRRRDILTWLDALRSDLRTTTRALRRSPGFSLAVIITLALGLGVNAAMFTFLDRVYLRLPAGVADPGAVRRLWLVSHDKSGAASVSGARTTPEGYRALGEAMAGAATLALYMEQPEVRIGSAIDAPTTTIVRADADFLPLLGVRAHVGRLYAATEAVLSAPARVAVISDALATSQFGGDTSALGATLLLKGVPFTVIGVLPPGFSGIDVERTDVWIPLGADPIGMAGFGGMQKGSSTYGLLARVSAAASEAAFEARATAILRAVHAANRQPDSLERVALGSIIEARGPGSTTREFTIATRLGGVALAVLLIACANVVNLLLAQAVRRRREIAVRLALGISRFRLIGLLASQSVILAVAAGVAALASAQVTGAVLRAQLVPDIHFADPPLHWRVAAFTLGAALIAGLATGLAPAIQASRQSVTEFLKSGARDGVVQRSHLRSALVGIQAALSVVLLVGAALFLRSLSNVESIRLGFDVPRIIFASPRFDDWRGMDSVAMARAVERVRLVPGVEAVALSTLQPMGGGMLVSSVFTATDSLTTRDPGSTTGFDPRLGAQFAGVSSNYFATTGVRILRGRDFASDPGRSAIVSEAMARRLWHRGDALGQCLYIGSGTRTGAVVKTPCYTVRGIAEEAHVRRVIETENGQFYVPLAHPPWPGMLGNIIVMRSDAAHIGAVGLAVRRILAEEFPGSRPQVTTMTDALAPSYRPFRLGALLFSVFGLLALFVAAVGVYSSVAYSVSQRTHELGVRAALGASAGDIAGGVLRRGLLPVAIGVIAGMAISVPAGRLVASLLYGITPSDPLVLMGVPLLLVAIAAAAALVPARRAARVDPIIALRAE